MFKEEDTHCSFEDPSEYTSSQSLSEMARLIPLPCCDAQVGCEVGYAQCCSIFHFLYFTLIKHSSLKKILSFSQFKKIIKIF